jgi:hypothetical protein
MRRVIGNNWIPAVVFAMTMTLTGCGSEHSPSGDAPTTSSKAVDVDAAFAQYLKAVTPFWCSNAYFDIGDMADAGNVDTMKLRVHEYRGVMTTWDDNLGRIAVPPAAQPIVDKLRELNAAEMADLDALAGVVDEKDKNRLLGLVYFDDALVGVEADRLSAALGHPEPRGRIASDQLEVAYQTFYKDIAPVYEMFEAALSRNDLNGAKAANAVEEDALQRYINRLGAIEWPPRFEGQVNVLRDNLRKVIEFDRRQVDVATTAQVVRAPDEGLPEAQFADQVKDSLQTGLLKLAAESNPPLKC